MSLNRYVFQTTQLLKPTNTILLLTLKIIEILTDNLYDSKEDELNTNTEIAYSMDYLYNTNNQLTDIKKGFVTDINKTNPEEFNFQYGADGKLSDIIATYTFGGKYTYNTNGLIDKKIKKDGKMEFDYEYDELGTIKSSYHYYDSPNGNIADMHYTYSYPDNETYIKNWYAINPADGTETKTFLYFV